MKNDPKHTVRGGMEIYVIFWSISGTSKLPVSNTIS
jgi:hypothetical protein